MTSKEYLSQYGQLNREIDRLLEEKARWMALALRVTPSLSEEPKGGGQPGGRIPAAVEKIAEWEEKINEKIDRLVGLRREIEGKRSRPSRKSSRRIWTKTASSRKKPLRAWKRPSPDTGRIPTRRRSCRPGSKSCRAGSRGSAPSFPA